MIRFATAITILLLHGTTAVRAEIRPDFEMLRDPEFVVLEPVKTFSPRLVPLWIEALGRSDVDVQRRAATTISLAHRAGAPGLERAVPELERLFSDPMTHPVVRYAAAQALIDVVGRESAPKLLEVIQRQGADLRQFVEPVLAEWKFEPARGAWHDRLESSVTRHRDLILAFRGLAQIGDEADIARLRQIVAADRLLPDLRIEAARTAGLVAGSGLESEAATLVSDSHGQPRALQIISRLCAVRLLARHQSEPARTLLVELARDAEPAVAGAALATLLEIDPALVLPLAERALQNPDSLVRLYAARAYFLKPTPLRLTVVARLLDDPHPDVRREVREELARLDQQPELRDSIRGAAMQILAANGWRGQEQAALLLAALGHNPAADRLIALLESNRPEVKVASAWGLKTLALPETLPAMLDKAIRQTKLRSGVKDADDPGNAAAAGATLQGLDEQVAHLLEAFGRLRYQTAVPLLIQYVPKPMDVRMGIESRGAAIWSLGWLFEGVNDEHLAGQLIARLTDTGFMPPETDLVRHTAAVTLARMKASQHVDAIRGFMGMGNVQQTRHGLAMRWAIMQLTGEELPDPEPAVIGSGTWFLEPFEPLADAP